MEKLAIIHLDGVSYDYFTKVIKIGEAAEIRVYPGYQVNEYSMFTGLKLNTHGVFSYWDSGIKDNNKLAKFLIKFNLMTSIRYQNDKNSFLQLLKGAGYKTSYISSSTKDKYALAKRRLDNDEVDVVFISEMHYDLFFHKNGVIESEPPEGLTDFILWLMSNKIRFVINSDHGMMPVIDSIAPPDLMQESIFIDSVIARYWKPKIIPPEDDNFSCEGSSNPGMGDIMLICAPGYVWHPDFFNKEVPKAMHGYAIDSPNNNAFLYIWPEQTMKKGNIYDVAPTIMETLGLKMKCDGVSLYVK